MHSLYVPHGYVLLHYVNQLLYSLDWHVMKLKFRFCYLHPGGDFPVQHLPDEKPIWHDCRNSDFRNVDFHLYVHRGTIRLHNEDDGGDDDATDYANLSNTTDHNATDHTNHYANQS